jgi:hypothetical protein
MAFQDSLQAMNDSINSFFNFIAGKLSNFKNLSLGEQIAYPCVGLGLILIVVSLVMFILF